MTKLTQMAASLPYVGDQPASSDMVCVTMRLSAGRTNQFLANVIRNRGTNTVSLVKVLIHNILVINEEAVESEES